MKKFTESSWIHVFDFLIALIIIACAIWAMYLMISSPNEGGSYRSAIRPLALGVVAILFGIYHFRYALNRYRERK